ncbi:MAG: von Willebrand factor type A domain-containing protein [Chloroflexi bacterium]|nr:von Willebrand factor type A domain-containing protein [Chloroflexota bacterium]
MRTMLLALVAAALVASACTSSALPAASSFQGVTPGHHQPTPGPVWPAGPAPTATPDGGVTFENPGTNPWVDPRQDGESTFGLDVDTASYTIAQRYVAEGSQPDPASIRVEEWVNAFDQGYPAPEEAAFAIVADGGPTPFTDEGEVLLRIGLQARDVANRDRQRAALTFVIDTSGSMERDGRLEIVKASIRILVQGLDRNDRVAIVTFGDEARVVLGPTPASSANQILDALDSLHPGGSTNLEAGLRLGYDLARQTLTENDIDRVILASDGVANVGLTDPTSILGAIKRDADAGIELISVGVGLGNYNDALLEQLADQGDGFYAYVNTREEAERLFTEELTSTLETVALDARAQVTFDRASVAAYRLVGYENRDIADRDFTNDDIKAGAIGAGHSVTALYAVRLARGVTPQSHLATVHLRWTDPDGGDAAETSRDIRTSDLARTFAATDPHFRFDAIVASTAEVLRGSELAGRLAIRDIAAVANSEAELLPATAEVHAFLDMLTNLGRLRD